MKMPGEEVTNSIGKWCAIFLDKQGRTMRALLSAVSLLLCLSIADGFLVGRIMVVFPSSFASSSPTIRNDHGLGIMCVCVYVSCMRTDSRRAAPRHAYAE